MRTELYNSGLPRLSPSQNAAESSILKVLAYFDIFHYPLTRDEIIQYLDKILPGNWFEEELSKMVADKTIFHHNGFYSLQNNPLLVHRRNEGNQRAEKLLPKAFRIGRFLHHFPYVRAIGISGSLSKNFADEGADIDFFIITKANRLWVARTFMHLFKKLTFLTGHQHYYCMNYYVDEQALVLQDKNVYTATEIKTLIPVSGKKTTGHFFEVNEWAGQFLPSCHWRDQPEYESSRTCIGKMIEWMLDNRFGSWLDDRLFKITTRRWKRKEEKQKKNKKGHTMGLITGKHFARSNPGSFQEKVLALYKQKLETITQLSFRRAAR